ncbi:TPA: DinI-like family protein [Klebsiella michiganensis]|nr:DinI-like family protein [Klebsiella michiganensis]
MISQRNFQTEQCQRCKKTTNKIRNQFEDCSLVVRRAGSDGLSVFGGAKEAKKTSG